MLNIPSLVGFEIDIGCGPHIIAVNNYNVPVTFTSKLFDLIPRENYIAGKVGGDVH